MGQRTTFSNDPTRDLFIVAVERELTRVLRPFGDVGDAARHLVLAPGAKRARPALCWLLGRHMGVNDAALVPLAAAVELIHSASLLHDDVLDAGVVRRGVVTANARYGNATAVLAGDFTLACALQLLEPAGARAQAAANAVLKEMTLAAKREIDARGDADLSEGEWRTIAEGKTAALFGLCARLVGEQSAAALGGDPSLTARLERACRHLGVAFQMADDVQDFVEDGSERQLEDLLSANPSFPVALASVAPAFRAALTDLWALPPERDARLARAEQLTAQMAAQGVFRVALDHAAHEVSEARRCFGASESGYSRELFAWAERLTQLPEALLPAAPLEPNQQARKRAQA